VLCICICRVVPMCMPCCASVYAMLCICICPVVPLYSLEF
jgi:hypothetical protein